MSLKVYLYLSHQTLASFQKKKDFEMPYQYVTTLYLLCRYRHAILTTDDRRHRQPCKPIFSLFDSTFRYAGVYTAVAVICSHAVPCSHAVSVTLCPCILVYIRVFHGITTCCHDGIPWYTRRRNEKWSQEGKNGLTRLTVSSAVGSQNDVAVSTQ